MVQLFVSSRAMGAQFLAVCSVWMHFCTFPSPRAVPWILPHWVLGFCDPQLEKYEALGASPLFLLKGRSQAFVTIQPKGWAAEDIFQLCSCFTLSCFCKKFLISCCQRRVLLTDLWAQPEGRCCFPEVQEKPCMPPTPNHECAQSSAWVLLLRPGKTCAGLPGSEVFPAGSWMGPRGSSSPPSLHILFLLALLVSAVYVCNKYKC